MSTLDQSVTAKIQSGVLPKSITEARLGRGRAGHCAVCHVVIRPPDAQVEVGGRVPAQGVPSSLFQSLASRSSQTSGASPVEQEYRVRMPNAES
jgi:hypothetical protein